jgi:spore coat polysaccharide biosynthesis protein SpsF (cytidylyltransferase family)
MTDVTKIVKTRSVQYSIAALSTGVPDICYTVYPTKGKKLEKIIVLGSNTHTDARFECAGKNGGFFQYNFKGTEQELIEYFKETRSACEFWDHIPKSFKL